jgi:flagellar M-ring protein FliF
MRFAEPPLPVDSGERSFFDIAFTSSTVARIIESALFALVALVTILLLGRPAVRRLVTLAKPSQSGALAGAAGSTALAGAGGGGGGGGGGLPAVAGGTTADQDGMVTLSMVQGQMRASSINRLQELVDSNPEQSLNVIRRWIAPPEEAA